MRTLRLIRTIFETVPSQTIIYAYTNFGNYWIKIVAPILNRSIDHRFNRTSKIDFFFLFFKIRFSMIDQDMIEKLIHCRQRQVNDCFHYVEPLFQQDKAT